MKKWKHLIVALALLVAGSMSFAANQDVPLPAIHFTNFLIARDVTANVSGSGGFLNNWILSVPPGWPYLCVEVENESASLPLVYGLNAYASGDDAIRGFSGNGGAWAQLPVQGSQPAASGNSQGWSVPGGSIGYLLVRLTSSSRVALVPSDLNSAASKVSILGSLNNVGACGPVDWDTVFFSDQESVTANHSTDVIGPASTFAYFNDLSTVRGCEFYLSTTNEAGTTPTLNVRIGTHDPFSTATDDRISFPQFTTGGPVFTIFPYSAGGATASHTASTGTLTVNTEVPGYFEHGLEVDYVVGGTNPNYTVALWGVCQR